MRRTSGPIDVLTRRLMVDGYRLSEQWIEPDPWSWVYFTRPALALLAVVAVSCAHAPVVPPIVVPPPVVVLVVPGPLSHDLSAWLDDDQVCVDAPKVQALYLKARCLSMGTIRSLILTLRLAEAAQ